MIRRNITINKNDDIWYVGNSLPVPKMGKVVRITKVPELLIGIQFSEEIPRGICCHSAGNQGCCLYATISEVLTPSEYANYAPPVSMPIQDLQSIEV